MSMSWMSAILAPLLKVPWNSTQNIDEDNGIRRSDQTLPWSAGDKLALEQLLSAGRLPELHGMADRFMTAERRDHTLQASVLVNEAT